MSDVDELRSNETVIRCDGGCGKSYPVGALAKYREGQGTGGSESMFYCSNCDPNRPNFGPIGNKIFGLD